MAYKEFYTCKDCGRIFYSKCLTCGWSCREHKIMCPNCRSIEKLEKKKYFICPVCFEPIVEDAQIKNPEYKLEGYNYCIHCGYEIGNVLKEARDGYRQSGKSDEKKAVP